MNIIFINFKLINIDQQKIKNFYTKIGKLEVAKNKKKFF